MKIIAPSDEHVPFQDDHARELAMKIASDFDPDLRIAGSDGLDFYSVSRWDRNPSRAASMNMQDEIDLWVVSQKEWRDATPHAKVRYILGNHELRLRKYLWSGAKELAFLDTLRFENLLCLDHLGIEYESFEVETHNLEVMVDSLVIKHGTLARKKSGMSASAEIEKEFYAANTLTGHCHRGGVVYTSTRRGVMKAAEGFCLCRLDPPYLANPNWQQGIVLAETIEDTVHFESIPFHRQHGFLTALWRGKEYLVKT